jgi:hypothetical protein
MARQLPIEDSGCTWAAARVAAPSFRPGEDQMNEHEWTKPRFDPLDETPLTPWRKNLARLNSERRSQIQAQARQFRTALAESQERT